MSHKTKLNAFLVELVLVILFFALSCAVVVQLFASAHQTSMRSSRQTSALLQAQQLMESVQASDSPQGVLQVFSGFEQQPQQDGVRLAAVFDGDWNQLSAAGSYQVSCLLTREQGAAGELVTVQLEIRDQTPNGAVLCSLGTSRYFPAPA